MKGFIFRNIFLFAVILSCKSYLYAQSLNDSISVQLSLASKNFSHNKIKYQALGFYIILENQSNRDIFFTDKLLEFHKQGLDTLSVYKIENDSEKIYKTLNNEKHLQVLGSKDSYNPLFNDYYIRHKLNRADSEKILGSYTSAGNKLTGSFNPLFLKARQKTILYFVASNSLFLNAGDYKATITTKSRESSENVPDVILNYQKVNLNKKASSVYYSVKKRKDQKFVLTTKKGSSDEKSIVFDKKNLVSEFP